MLKDISKKRIIIFTSKNNQKLIKLRKFGCEIFLMKQNKNKELNLNNIMKKIFSININNILVEAGGIFLSNLLANKLVDELHVFQSIFTIGKLGKPMIISVLLVYYQCITSVLLVYY